MNQAKQHIKNTIGEAIVGCAFNYDTSQIAPFLNSLEQVGYKGSLVLLINDKTTVDTSLYSFETIYFNVDKQLALHVKTVKLAFKIFRRLKVESFVNKVVLKTASKRLNKNQNLSKWHVAYFYSFYFLMTSRFFLYDYFLKSHSFKKVLFTDLADVFFQGYPFPKTEFNHVAAFGENENYQIGQERFNSYWIKEGFGNETFKRIYDSKIYCAGTIIAQDKSITLFLKDFMNVIIGFGIPPLIKGIDQGVFNYMINYQKLPYFTLYSNGDHVFTMGLNLENEVIVTNGKLYLKGKTDFMPNIVHQYNRHSAKTDEIIMKLCSGNQVAQV